MRMPRRGILARILIYGSLIGYFGWGAAKRYMEKRDAEHSQEQLQETLEGQKSTITLPDGTKQEIYEITPEQAKELFGVEVDDEGKSRPGKNVGDRPPVPADADPAPVDATADN